MACDHVAPYVSCAASSVLYRHRPKRSATVLPGDELEPVMVGLNAPMGDNMSASQAANWLRVWAAALGATRAPSTNDEQPTQRRSRRPVLPKSSQRLEPHDPMP